MIKIQFDFVGTLKFEGYKSGQVIEIEDNISISEFLNNLGMSKEKQKYIVAVVNGKDAKLDYKLKNNDKLSLFLPIGGG